MHLRTPPKGLMRQYCRPNQYAVMKENRLLIARKAGKMETGKRILRIIRIIPSFSPRIGRKAVESDPKKKGLSSAPEAPQKIGNPAKLVQSPPLSTKTICSQGQNDDENRSIFTPKNRPQKPKG